MSEGHPGNVSRRRTSKGGEENTPGGGGKLQRHRYRARFQVWTLTERDMTFLYAQIASDAFFAIFVSVDMGFLCGRPIELGVFDRLTVERVHVCTGRTIDLMNHCTEDQLQTSELRTQLESVRNMQYFSFLIKLSIRVSSVLP